MEQSRRDDLESVGYVLMYFLRGELPWQGLKVINKKDKYTKILDKKKETSSEELCKGFPKEFCHYVDYTRKLGYNENPDYDMLKQLFLDVIKKLNQKMDYIYDWTKKTDLYFRKEIKNIDDEKSENEFNKKEKIESDNNYKTNRLNSKLLKINCIPSGEDKLENGFFNCFSIYDDKALEEIENGNCLMKGCDGKCYIK